MSAQDLLNADVTTVWALVRRGLAWWVEELDQLVPANLRPGRRPGGLVAEVRPATGEVRLWRDGGPAATAARGRRVDVALAPEAVLTRRLELPMLGRGDMAKLLALDIDRLTPFTADRVRWDFEVVGRDAETGRSSVVLAAATRESCDAALEAARAKGLIPRRLGLFDPSGAVRFDFGRSMAAEGPRDRRPLYWGLALGALVLANLAAFVLRDVSDVAALREAVDSQQTPVALARRLETSVAREAARRRDLLQRQAADEPLRIVDAATLALPSGEWVQHLEWNGRTLRLVGFRKADFDVAAALRRSPAIAGARTLPGEVAPAGSSGVPFDVTAEARSPSPGPSS